MRNKTKSYNTFLPLLPSSQAQLQSWFSLPPSSEGCRGQGMGAAVSSSHIVSVIPSSWGGGLLTLFPCSRVGSLPRETVLHELLQCESFPWAVVLHELLQSGSFPWSTVLQEETDPAWVLNGVTSPARKPDPVWASLSMGPQVLPGDCFSMDFSWVHSLLWVHLPAPAWGLPWSTGGYLLHCGPPWL